MDKEENKEGRPTKYKKEFNELVYKYSLLGLNDVEMSNLLGICTATFYNWQKDHPEFLESIGKGKDIADANVAESLYNRAIGYTHDEEKVFCNEGVIVRADTKKHYPPDVSAIKSWLHNRKAKLWREKIDIEHGGKVETVIIIDDIPDIPEDHPEYDNYMAHMKKREEEGK